jgi:REP element-mobilizing transposase RayT
MTQSIGHQARGAQGEQEQRALELTFWCAGRKPLLTNDRWNRVLAESIDQAFQRRGLGLAAFAFLPNCARLVAVAHEGDVNIPRLLFVVKRTFAQWVRRDMSRSDHPLRKQLTVRDVPGHYRFRFWEPGPGEIHQLDTPAALVEAIKAVHASPVRAGSCETPDKWRWSSWRRYHLPLQPPDPDLPKIQTLPYALSPASTPD